MNNFFPVGYEVPKSNSGYLKIAQGENRIRIMSNPIIGWIYFNNNSEPIRSKERPEEMLNPSPTSKIKHFWAFVVLDYKDNKFKIYEVTQATIQNDIFNYHRDSDWGDPKEYDIKIKREGEKITTKYFITPCPKAPIDNIQEEYKKSNINLEALFENKNPFENTGDNLFDNKEHTIEEANQMIGDMQAGKEVDLTKLQEREQAEINKAKKAQQSQYTDMYKNATMQNGEEVDLSKMNLPNIT